MFKKGESNRECKCYHFYCLIFCTNHICKRKGAEFVFIVKNLRLNQYIVNIKTSNWSIYDAPINTLQIFAEIHCCWIASCCFMWNEAFCCHRHYQVLRNTAAASTSASTYDKPKVMKTANMNNLTENINTYFYLLSSFLLR